jgi:hypothetical protein
MSWYVIWNGILFVVKLPVVTVGPVQVASQ